MIQQSPELSLQYFNEAKRFRHQGNFKGAIQMLKNSILVYQNDPDLPMNFYSLGKTYYLAVEFTMSLKCYEIYCNICAIRQPEIISDYKKMDQRNMRDRKEGERVEDFIISQMFGGMDASVKFNSSFRNLAHNVGHAIEDPKNISRFYREISWYRYELMGENPQSKMPEVYDSYEKYDESICTESGFKKIYSWMDNFLTSRDIEKYTVEMINDILNS